MEDSNIQYDIGSPTAFERLVILSILQFLAASDRESCYQDQDVHRVMDI